MIGNGTIFFLFVTTKCILLITEKKFECKETVDINEYVY